MSSLLLSFDLYSHRHLSLSLSHIYTLMIVKSNVTVYPIVLEDAVDADLLSILHETTSFFSSKREENEKILVFCNAGVSRSVAVVLAHIVWKKMKERSEDFGGDDIDGAVFVERALRDVREK